MVQWLGPRAPTRACFSVPDLGTRSHMIQMRVCMPQQKIPDTSAWGLLLVVTSGKSLPANAGGTGSIPAPGMIPHYCRKAISLEAESIVISQPGAWGPQPPGACKWLCKKRTHRSEKLTTVKNHAGFQAVSQRSPSWQLRPRTQLSQT